MPNLEYICEACEHRFNRVVMRGVDPAAEPCPRCGENACPPKKQNPSLFDGISGFSDFGKDTN